MVAMVVVSLLHSGVQVLTGAFAIKTTRNRRALRKRASRGAVAGRCNLRVSARLPAEQDPAASKKRRRVRVEYMTRKPTESDTQ